MDDGDEALRGDGGPRARVRVSCLGADLVSVCGCGPLQLGQKVEAVLARGELVPTELVVDLMMATLQPLAGKPVLLDGFPRSLAQAHVVDTQLKFDFVLNIDVPFETIVERLSARLCHLPSGRIYNTAFKPPKVPGKDDVTGEPLVIRDDDKPETVRRRLETYRALTQPLIDHYAAATELKNFAGTESNAIYPHVFAYLRDQRGLRPLVATPTLK
jgi:nucleoside-triphosphate--adenylate kinase